MLLLAAALRKDNAPLVAAAAAAVPGSPLALADGFFICPDDMVNRRSRFPKLILEESVMDFFAEWFPGIASEVETFAEMLGGFDRLDYETFKLGARLSYLFAAAAYLHGKGERLPHPNRLYTKGRYEEVLAGQRSHLTRFLTLALQNRCQPTLKSLFPFATKLLAERCIEMPREFSSLATFAPSDGYHPYAILSGDAFELHFRERFEHDAALQESIARRVGAGALVSLDHRDFSGMLNVSVPDLLSVAGSVITPIDLKLNLRFASWRQVSASNLRELFSAEGSPLREVFRGYAVDGVRL